MNSRHLLLIAAFAASVTAIDGLRAEQYVEIDQLRQLYQEQTAKAERMAEEYRQLRAEDSKRQEIKKALEQLVNQSFHLRQQLQTKEIAQARQELEQVERRIAKREPLQGVIVRRRVEDLLLSKQISWYGKERFEPAPVRLIRPGDVVAVYIEGVLPFSKPDQPPEPPPVNKLESGGIVTGFPLPVAHDGTIRLPLIKRIKIAGMTIPQAEQVIAEAYIDADILRPEKASPMLMFVPSDK